MTDKKPENKTDAELVADAKAAIAPLKAVNDQLKALAAKCNELILP